MHAHDRTIQTPAGNLWSRDHGGNGPALVLWPSIFTDHRIFDALLPALVPHFRVIVVDGPGHGRSTAGPELSLSAQSRALNTIIDVYGLGACWVGGCSWGGLVATQLALDNPATVRGLVLMNTPMDIDGAAPGGRARLITLGARVGLWSGVFRNGVARSFFSQTALDAAPDYARHFHDMLRQASPAGLARAVGSVLLAGTPLVDRMPDVTRPTLVIAGQDDPMYAPDRQQAAARLLPDGYFAAVPGRHISPVEAPGDVAAEILRFIRQRT
ncbi:alpha/beta fold hydrolase [Pseudooceanicola sp. C21-150M6]|uniref:alpha/beta fold hydrolase n=1 Tax=Pseudooceanicola sp. C21-150M6 TaxID=3434355 RepID=UPI003D7FF6B9